MMRTAGRLRPAERGSLAGMAAVILVLNGAGWGIFVLSVLPHHFRYTVAPPE